MESMDRTGGEMSDCTRQYQATFLGEMSIATPLTGRADEQQHNVHLLIMSDDKRGQEVWFLHNTMLSLGSLSTGGR